MTTIIKKYRGKTLRLQTWDYSKGGRYYITLNTKDRAKAFGNIADGMMNLSEQGKLAEQLWLEIPKHFADTWIDQFVIMPEHMHGIIIMKRSNPSASEPSQIPIIDKDSTYALQGRTDLKNAHIGRSDASGISSPSIQNYTPGALGVIINQYKRICTIAIKKAGLEWQGWQPRYYEEIIGSDQRLKEIRWYILTNPANYHKKK
jgi:putative transposase